MKLFNAEDFDALVANRQAASRAMGACDCSNCDKHRKAARRAAKTVGKEDILLDNTSITDSSHDEISGSDLQDQLSGAYQSLEILGLEPEYHDLLRQLERATRANLRRSSTYLRRLKDQLVYCEPQQRSDAEKAIQLGAILRAALALFKKLKRQRADRDDTLS